jgi:hypothetical protein
MNTDNKGIANGKKGETWSLHWVTDSGSHEYRDITLVKDVTHEAMNGTKPLKFIKDGKKDQLTNISQIKGAQWHRLPKLKRSSSPILPELVINKGVKRSVSDKPSISPVSPGNERLPILKDQSTVSSSSSKKKSSTYILPNISKRGGVKQTKRKMNKLKKRHSRRKRSC